MNTYYVYILECHNGSFYTGYTTDLEKRFQKHLNGTASKYTRAFKPKRIAASWLIQAETASAALQLEAKIKKLSKPEKQQLTINPASISKLTQAI